MAVLTFWNHPELISRKIRVAVKLLNFHSVEYPPKFPIRLPRSVIFFYLIYSKINPFLLSKFWSKAVLKILIWNQSSVKSFMNIKKKKTSKWISKEGTSLFIWEESFSISHSSIMNSENHWRAKKMDVLANYRPGAERKFPDHYRILVASKCWTAQRRLCCAVLFVDSWSCENTDLGSLLGKW